MTTKTATSEAQVRAGIYDLLARVFSSHPTGDSVHAVGQMAKELGIPCPTDLPLGELDREYMGLFVVPNPLYVAPYESVFRDHWPLPALLIPGANPAETGRTIKGLVMGESTVAVRQFYLEAGLVPEDELPDHIGNELRFMAYLWASAAEASDNAAAELAKLRARFSQEHLLQWIGDLRKRVAERDTLGYYQVALVVTETVLQEDS